MPYPSSSPSSTPGLPTNCHPPDRLPSPQWWSQQPLEPSDRARTATRSEFSSTLLSSSLDENSKLANLPIGNGTQRVQPGDLDTSRLRPHRSRLPLAIYLLSFATPFRGSHKQPSLLRFTTSLRHPYTLFAIGILTAIPSGCALPAIDMMLGYWTTGMTQASPTDDQLTGRGNRVTLIMTAIGVVILFTSWAFPLCCEYAILESSCRSY